MKKIVFGRVKMQSYADGNCVFYNRHSFKRNRACINTSGYDYMFASGLLLPPALYVHVHLYAFMVICSEEFS